ncbi:odorant receptor 13a-like [Apis florea]|uniref:odorant receptor 13a-like n=1 Tax=Apis florea TaxID=7463 RepID=UPI0006292516|nr:odorant receptor 13a-like [Apis florea]
MEAETQLDVSMSLSIFFLKNVGVWISNDPAEKRRMKILVLITLWNTMLGAVVIFRDIYFTFMYNGDILYVITNFLTVMISFVKIIIIMIYKKEFIDMILYMEKNFWNVKYDFQEEEILNNCRKTCIFFVTSVSTIGICAMISYAITPIIEYYTENLSERILPFHVWLNLPIISVTPYYEILFAAEVLSIYCVALCYFCFDNVFCILAVHLAGQFNILKHKFAKLCDTDSKISKKDEESRLAIEHVQVLYERFKEYVRRHQSLINYCERLENVYTVIILGQVVISSVLICLFGYQILVNDVSIGRRSIFVFLLLGSMCLLFMFTYSCNSVIVHSENIATGAYSALWTTMPMNKFGRMLRNDLILVIERSRRVCCLTANGFFPVSLETYTTILSTAVSYFTLLRNNLEE